MYAKPGSVDPANGPPSGVAANATHANGGGLRHEFKDLIADVEELIMQTASLSGEELKLARAKLADRLDSAKESLKDMGNTVARGARRTAAATNDYVHDQPWKAVAIGATVGLLLGVVLARR